MNEIPEQMELPGMPEKLPEAPPGWHWRFEATYGANGRLVLYQGPSAAEKEAAGEEPK